MSDPIETIRAALYGSPASDDFKPDRSGVILAFSQLSDIVKSAVAGIVYYDSGAQRQSDTTRPAGTLAKAANESDYYRWNGSSWVLDNSLRDSLVALVQGLVNDARAAAEDAENAKEAAQAGFRALTYSLAPPGNGPLLRCDGTMDEWVGDTASWTQIDRPTLTAFAPSPIIAQAPGAAGSSDAGGVREGYPYVDTDGAWYIFYGAGNGSTTDAGGPWRPQYAKSTDRGLTWTKKGEVPGISLNHGFDSGKWPSRDNLFVFRHTDGFYYFHTLTAGGVIANQVCNAPYTSDVWKAATIEGPYTYVGPTLMQGPNGRFDELNAYASCLVKNGSTYVMFYSATTYEPTQWYIGMATSTTPYGPFTSTGTPVLPDSVRGQDENPEVFWHAGLARWVMTTNSVSKEKGLTDQNRVYFSTSLTDWSAATFNVLQRVSPLDGNFAIGHARPYRNAALSVGSSMSGYGVVIDALGGVPTIFDTDPTDGGTVFYHTGRRLKYAALEPSKNALAGKLTGGGTGMIRRPLDHTDFIADIVARPRTLGGTFDFGYLLQDTGDNADGYRIAFNLSGSVTFAEALSRYDGGQRWILTTAGAGIRAQAGLDMRIRIWVRGRHHRVYVDGELQLSFEDDGYAFGRHVSLRVNGSADVDIPTIRIRKRDQIIINGVSGGKRVTLRGAGGIPLATAQSTGAQIVLQAPHYPALSVDVDGTPVFLPARGVWGGDVIDV